MRYKTIRRLYLWALLAIAVVLLAYGVYWCMEPGKVPEPTTDIPPIEQSQLR